MLVRGTLQPDWNGMRNEIKGRPWRRSYKQARVRCSLASEMLQIQYLAIMKCQNEYLAL